MIEPAHRDALHGALGRPVAQGGPVALRHPGVFHVEEQLHPVAVRGVELIGATVAELAFDPAIAEPGSLQRFGPTLQSLRRMSPESSHPEPACLASVICSE